MEGRRAARLREEDYLHYRRASRPLILAAPTSTCRLAPVDVLITRAVVASNPQVLQRFAPYQSAAILMFDEFAGHYR